MRKILLSVVLTLTAVGIALYGLYAYLLHVISGAGIDHLTEDDDD